MSRTAQIAVAACFTLALAAVAARGQAVEKETIKLKFHAGGPASAVYTPSKVLTQGTAFNFNGAAGKIKATGQQVMLAGRYLGMGYSFGVDCDGDGKILGGEWVRINPQTNSAAFLLTPPSGEGKTPFALRFTALSVGVQNNQANNVSGRFMNDGCMAGKFRDTDILLFDDNMDGLFSQDGKDAIAIGGSPGAMPLRSHHQIGKSFYSLDVKSDGSEITFQREDDLELGAADVPVSAALLRCFMVEDDAGGRAFDLRASGATGIPAGKYRLSYAVLGTGNRFVVAGPTTLSHTYPVVKDMLNILRFGGAISLHFSAYYAGRDQQIRVRSTIVPYGEGGEKYNMAFAGFHALGENPNVMFVVGGTTLTNGHMIYNSDDALQEYSDWVPAGFTKKTGKIVLVCELPILGKATGILPLETVLDNKAADPPDAKEPATVTRKLPEGTRLGGKPVARPETRPAVAKPEPTKPAPPPEPRPIPKTQPAKPRTADPEYDAAELLAVAQTFLKDGRKDLGMAKLREVAKKYKGTAAAKKAEDMILDIELREEKK
jgi:hypothetical protein